MEVKQSVLVHAAKTLALAAHRGQAYGRRIPFEEHLKSVAEIGRQFGEKIEAACWLHDILEDCPHIDAQRDILPLVGPEVLAIIQAVTDEPGKNRKERKAKTYPKIRSNPDAIIVKLCDRICNARYSKENGDPEFKMYQKEHTEFVQALSDGQARAYPLWMELNELINA
jgi:(p)ppGpp synthase/HD superfamily hydrolase